MTLDEEAKAWVKDYTAKYPWAREIIEKYGLDLALYDLEHETSGSTAGFKVDKSNLIEDVHFLKTFDEYIAPRLPQNFSRVLEVGTGQWIYACALAAFFRKHGGDVSIIGIDKDITYVDLARELIKNGWKFVVLKLYREGKISTGKAAKDLEISVSEFIDLLKEFGINSPIEYEDFLESEKTMKKIWE